MPYVPYPPVGRRLASACIDALIAYLGVGFIVGGTLMQVSVILEDIWRIFSLPESEPINSWILVAIVFAAVLCGWITYLGVSNGMGASLGKMIVGLRLVDDHGSKIGILRGMARATISLLFLSSGVVLIDFAWILFDDKRRTLHDRLVGSYVIDRSATLRPLVAARAS
jgi:uncharacterized RDD family membrane protein YckC